MFKASFHADHSDELRAITVRVLIIHGAADQSAPIQLTGRRTAKLVPGSVYKEYPTAGHGLFVTQAVQIKLTSSNSPAMPCERVPSRHQPAAACTRSRLPAGMPRRGTSLLAQTEQDRQLIRAPALHQDAAIAIRLGAKRAASK